MEKKKSYENEETGNTREQRIDFSEREEQSYSTFTLRGSICVGKNLNSELSFATVIRFFPYMYTFKNSTRGIMQQTLDS